MGTYGTGDVVMLRRDVTEKELDSIYAFTSTWPHDNLRAALLSVIQPSDHNGYLTVQPPGMDSVTLKSSMVETIIDTTVRVRESVTDEQLSDIYLTGVDRTMRRQVKRFSARAGKPVVWVSGDKGTGDIWLWPGYLEIVDPVVVDSPELVVYKAKVRDVALRAATANGWCDEIDYYLAELDIQGNHRLDRLWENSIIGLVENLYIKTTQGFLLIPLEAGDEPLTSTQLLNMSREAKEPIYLVFDSESNLYCQFSDRIIEG